jgi:hypothetical protein
MMRQTTHDTRRALAPLGATMRALSTCGLLPTALLLAAAPPALAQRARCAREASPPPSVLYATVGSATGGPSRVSRAMTDAGFAPLADNAVVGGLGFWMAPGNGCGLLQLEANVVQWEARSAADGRRADFWAADFMVYGGAPVVTTGRTSMYPLLGLGLRVHFLDLTGAGSSSDRATSFATALRRDGEWEGPAQLVGDLAVGAHFLAGSRASRHGLVIGARMGYIVGPAHNQWVLGADTIRGPMVNTSGPYGRLLVGMSFGRREGPRPLPPTRPEPRIRDGRPTRRIG